MKPVVRRSALKMWLMAMGGVPLLVISIDALISIHSSSRDGWITENLTRLIFRPQDLQIYESRDAIYAWVMLGFSVFFVLWGLKELFLPTRVVEARDEGLALRLAGPLRSATVIPWELVKDVRNDETEDEGAVIPMLVVDLVGTRDIPEDPWGARWIGERRLGIPASDWAEDPQQVAEMIKSFASSAVKRAAASATARLWQEP